VSLLVPLAPDPDTPLSRRNPVAKLSLAAIVAAGMLVSLDPVTPGVMLAIEVLAFPLSGVRLATLLRRTWPLGLGIVGLCVANVIAVDGGRVLLDLGPLEVTEDGVRSAVSVALRVMAVTLPGIVVLAATDPMDLADALVQRWHVPARFAYGALAALRLLPLLSSDWHLLTRARRARGLDAGRSPWARLVAFGGLVFAVLVAAIRRGVRLAAAMEARGFGATGVARSVARPQPMRPADWALVAAAVAAVLVATAVSVSVGSWRLPFA
jgi:energy-coupling factor transport system permease protein